MLDFIQTRVLSQDSILMIQQIVRTWEIVDQFKKKKKKKKKKKESFRKNYFITKYKFVDSVFWKEKKFIV